MDKFPLLKGTIKFDAESSGPFFHPRIRAIYEQHIRRFSDEKSVSATAYLRAYGHPYMYSRGSLKTSNPSDAAELPSSYVSIKRKKQRPSTAPIARDPVLKPSPSPSFELPPLSLPPTHHDLNGLPAVLNNMGLASSVIEESIEHPEEL